ncbi:glycosyltransferase family 1 protein [Marinomonas piezotolerans]|uniref:Glycosyltransferase family 1 protein n=1 Tax=Marinomonas piezotolerans TaxID=2213058 RepID=A0A370U7F6_9GAMM|nr:glycosyltransferase family 4 protein [Marinomonas piezotolerans]RDL43693.1 glycosyltransferase family 1 protein [Marinomonas piezotolerans]
MLHISHINLAKGFRGGERQTAILITELGKQPDIKQQLVCRKDSPLREHLKAVPNLTFSVASNQLDGHFSAAKTDVIHAHEAKAVHWAWLHHLMHHTPYILTRRVDAPIKDKWLNKKTYTSAHARVAISNVIRNIIDKKKWGATDLVFSVKGDLRFNPQSSAQIKQQFPNKTLVGHIGALVDKHKGQKLIIDCARKMAQSHPHMQFLCLGDGKDREELESLSVDLSNVTWLGFKNNVGDYIHAFDYFIFPSRNEGLGSTLLDVIDAKIPIIASDAGGIPDIIQHEQTGLSIQNGNADALCSAIARLDKDKELQEKLTAGASAHLQKFTPASMAQSYMTIYKAALK